MLSSNFNLITILVSFILLLSGFCLGMLFRSARNYKFKKRILELENEMVQNHAEILSLVQSQKGTYSSKNNVSNAPVITLNSNPNRLQENMGNAK